MFSTKKEATTFQKKLETVGSSFIKRDSFENIKKENGIISLYGKRI